MASWKLKIKKKTGKAVKQAKVAKKKLKTVNSLVKSQK